MIEKVRSIAMISSLDEGWWGVAALISTPSADGKRPRNPTTDDRCRQPTVECYDNFTKMNLI
jgi:hypothetical protein